MCRIAGIIDQHSPPSEALISTVADCMRHGGPDDSGIYRDQTHPLAFGFRRLSLLDLSQLGHQPMLDATGQIVLVFNGEIYNFRALRNELISKGYCFRSTSDTEVVVNAYLEWGKACFTKFNGMFALALLDKRKNVLLLARDHAGIKPLYYYLKDKKLCFASEVRAFIKMDKNWPENSEWRKYFLLFGHLPEPITTLRDVKPLPKGSFLELHLNSFEVSIETFYKNTFNYSIFHRHEALTKIRTQLTETVERHLISDAPVGLFLSGGLDSSLLTIIASKVIPSNLQTLSIVFEDDRYSEKQYQDVIIRKTGANHRSYVVTRAIFKESIPDIIQAMDQPSTDGINSYFISKYAHEFGLKAALSGIGADELFGGYPSFGRANMLSKLRWLPEFMFSLAGITKNERLKKVSFLRLKNAAGDYLFSRGLFTPHQIAELLDCSVSEIDTIITSFQKQLPSYVEGLHPLESVSYFESNFYMQNQLLKDTDYMSMWHGLEVRVPFLDKELIDLVYSISPTIRYDSQQRKSLLIDAFRTVLPEEICRRTKQGFTFPFGEWMKEVHLSSENENVLKFRNHLSAGKIHWSRYWAFVLSLQQFSMRNKF